MDSNKSMPPFGSIGDSADVLEEWLKQHSSTTPLPTNIEQLNQQYCGLRLPCGICRMTNMQCPMQVQKYEVTCSMQTGAPTGTVK